MKSLYVLKGASAMAAALLCIPIALGAATDRANPAVTTTPLSTDNSAISANLRADPLLSVDMNRGEIVSRLMTQWQGELAAPQRESLKDKLVGLRADRLLAVSLVGTFDGVLQVLNGQEQTNHALTALSALKGGDASKAIGDPDKDLVYTPITPCRIVDTRPSEGGSGALAAGSTSAFNAVAASFAAQGGSATDCNIPRTATAIAGSFAMLNAQAGGHITFWAVGTAQPNAAAGLFNPSSQVTYALNSAIVPLCSVGPCPGRQFNVFVSGSLLNVTFDVSGYFAPPSSTGSGLRVIQNNADEPSVINGSRLNSTNAGIGGTVSGGVQNVANGHYNTIGGGRNNSTASADSTVAGGARNSASGNVSSIGGGDSNTASGGFSTVPGGAGNVAGGYASFAAGQGANAQHDGSFVWADAAGPTFASTATNTFTVRAVSGARFVTAIDGAGNATRTTTINSNGTVDFGSVTRQNINLWGSGVYGIGVQAGTQYFRTDASNASLGTLGFSWHAGGVHSDAANAPGAGGLELMRLSNTGTLMVRGPVLASTLLNTSDRNVKSLFENVNAKAILAKVAGLPISKWVYSADDKKDWHIGPMAQDFRKAFGLGQDDKTIATVDADGIALAAIQGLHQLVNEKDAKIGKLERANEVMKRQLAAIMRKLGM